MDIHFQNKEIIRLCESLNGASKQKLYRAMYDNTLNALDFITDGTVKIATGLETDINEYCLYRLRYKYFDLKDGRTGYCIPIDIIFTQFEDYLLNGGSGWVWFKNRIYPSVFLTGGDDFNKQVIQTHLNIQREKDHLLEEYILSPPLQLLLQADILSVAGIVQKILSFLFDNKLFLENGRIKNIDPFPRIIFGHSQEFRFDEILKKLWLHTRKKDSVGAFINY